jgi:DNA helicase-2/ATP-dependent DNA helicase PcrA
VTQQSRTSDRHVYGAKSRFLTREVMACLDPVAWGEADTEDAPVGGRPNVDVAGKLRSLWS